MSPVREERNKTRTDSCYDLARAICSKSSLSTEVSKAFGPALSWPHEKQDGVCCGSRGNEIKSSLLCPLSWLVVSHTVFQSDKYKNGWGSCLRCHTQNDEAKLASVRLFLILFIYLGTCPLLSGLLFSVNEPYQGAAVWHCCHLDSDETASLSLCVMHRPYDAVCRQCQLWCVILTYLYFLLLLLTWNPSHEILELECLHSPEFGKAWGWVIGGRWVVWCKQWYLFRLKSQASHCNDYCSFIFRKKNQKNTQEI